MQSALALYEKIKDFPAYFQTFPSFKKQYYKIRDLKYPKIKDSSDLATLKTGTSHD